MTSDIPADRRVGPAGAIANELVSVLTAVVVAADEFAEGSLVSSWTTQRRLGVLERALTQALRLVRTLSHILRTSAERESAGGAGPGLKAPIFVGRLSELVSEN